MPYPIKNNESEVGIVVPEYLKNWVLIENQIIQVLLKD